MATTHYNIFPKHTLQDDLCRGDDVFFAATGVSDGDLLRGVRYHSGGASTNSIVMRSKSGTGASQKGEPVLIQGGWLFLGCVFCRFSRLAGQSVVR